MPRDTKRFFGGSSPLTRGTRLQGWSARFMTRFIPAYAGNSRRAYVTALPNAVHPRLRGELGCQKSIIDGAYGSSPLTRGTHASAISRTRLVRFIPAYAGNSVRPVCGANPDPVHPRLRGELGSTIADPVAKGGSSPLTRGTLRNRNRRIYVCRFIPAYAGNSLKDGINPSIHLSLVTI